MIQDLHIDGELHLAPGHVQLSLPGLDREGHTRLVAHHPAPHQRIGCRLARHAEPEPPLQRLTHGLTHLLRECRLGGVVVERQNGHRFDVGQEAAAEPVGARGEPEAHGANGGYATKPAE